MREANEEPSEPRRRRFEALFATHHDSLLAYLLRRTTSRDDAADVLAETFLTAWRRLDHVPDDRALPWLYGVARRLLTNHRRGENRRAALTARLRADLAATGPHAYVDLAQTSHGPTGVAFQQLAEPDREVLALTAWEGLTPAEIAVVLGCSRNAVRIRMHRARRRFTRLLDRRADVPGLQVALSVKETNHD